MESEAAGLSLPLIVIAFLLVAHALVVLITIAIVRSRDSVLEELEIGEGLDTSPAQAVLEASDAHLFDLQIVRILLVLGIAAITLRILSTAALLPWVTWFAGLELHFVTFILGFVALSLITIVSLALVRVAEALALARPENVLCSVATPLLAMHQVIQPATRPLKSLLDWFVRTIGLPVPLEREFVRSADDISEMVEQSSEAGQIEETEKEMIQSVFRISDTLVREVMTPRADIVSVNIDQDPREIRDSFVEHEFSRVLVIGRDLDDVRGVLHAKDLISFVGRQLSEVRVSELVREVHEIAETLTLNEVLREFRSKGLHFAVVSDEHGGVAGVVTFEDLIEEIVGDVFDEFDIPDEERETMETRSGDLLVDGSMALGDLNELHGFHFPDGDYDTIAGFVIHSLGRLPREGEVVEFNGLRLRVEELVQNRITLLRIIPSYEEENEDVMV